jgi:hypothetical protein
MTTSKNAGKKPSSSPDSKSQEFSWNHLLVIALAIPLLVVTACHHTTVDSSVTFGKLVMAASVDANNAPTALSDTFSPSQKTIYVVADAEQVAPGTKLAASWTRDNIPVQVSDDVIADKGYNNTNIEFHLDAGVGGFATGNYKVQLMVNDQPGPSATFTVK